MKNSHSDPCVADFRSAFRSSVPHRRTAFASTLPRIERQCPNVLDDLLSGSRADRGRGPVDGPRERSDPERQLPDISPRAGCLSVEPEDGDDQGYERSALPRPRHAVAHSVLRGRAGSCEEDAASVVQSVANIRSHQAPEDKSLQKITKASVVNATPTPDDDDDGKSAVRLAQGMSRHVALLEKIQQDFEDPVLVRPQGRFDIPSAALQIIGGLRLPEKFAEDKSVGVKTSAALTTDGLEDTYAWSSPTKTTGATAIAVLCQKGQKSPEDPTPNQDNYFMKFVDGVSVYGIFDGHGPFGHLVSFRLVQSLPHILLNHPSFGTDWEKAIRESFLAAQQELLTLAEEKSINLEASGSAGSILLMEEHRIHIAHIGDARVMLASYKKGDSKIIFTTEDHKPELPTERKRLEDAGTEVRQVDKNSWRIFRRRSNFPGLAMSRAFGDTACAGVIQEPEYRQILMEPSDKYYAILASDGIWEFIEAEEALTLTAKKLRLKGPRETVQSIVTQSRKRWAAVCGEYCDDITGMLVQWNAKSNGSDTNHLLSLQRHEPSAENVNSKCESR